MARRPMKPLCSDSRHRTMVLRKQSVIAANGRRSKLEKYDQCDNDERVGEHDRRNVLVISPNLRAAEL